MPTNAIGEPGDELMIIDKKLIASIRWNKELGAKLKFLRGDESMQSLAKRALCAYQLIQHLERGDIERHPSPTFAIIDSQSVKSAAMVSQSVGYDAGKKIKGRKRFMTVDTLGLVLRVLVTAASVPERSGGQEVLKRVKEMGDKVSRLTTIWTDGGFDGPDFMMWVMDVCRWIVHLRAATRTNQGFRLAQKTLGGGAHFRLVYGVSPIGQRL